MDVNRLPLTLTQPYVLITVFAERKGVCTVWQWWLSPPYTIEVDKLGGSFIRWVLFWEPLVYSPPSLFCQQVLLGEHQLTFTSETLEWLLVSLPCLLTGHGGAEHKQHLRAFSEAFSVSRRVKNAHKWRALARATVCVMEQRKWPVFYWSRSKSSPGGRIAALVLQWHFISVSSRAVHGKAVHGKEGMWRNLPWWEWGGYFMNRGQLLQQDRRCSEGRDLCRKLEWGLMYLLTEEHFEPLSSCVRCFQRCKTLSLIALSLWEDKLSYLLLRKFCFVSWK